MVETAPTLAPLDKGKGVVVIPSEDEEDTEDGQVFKRRRTTKVVTSHSSSNHGAESLREHPPSASSPPHQLALGYGAESAPTPIPPPAPELPQPVQRFLRGFLHQATLGGPTGKVVEEGITYSFGEYLSHASSWREQAEAKANDCLALENELALLKEKTQAQERRWFHLEVTNKETLKEAKKAKEAANKRPFIFIYSLMLLFFYCLENVSTLYICVDHCFYLLLQRCICCLPLTYFALLTYFTNYRQHVPFFLIFSTKTKCIPFSCSLTPFAS